MKQASKTRPPRHLVFDLTSWNELRELFEKSAREFDSLNDEELDNDGYRKKVIARCKAALMPWLERDALICTVEKFTPASTVARGRRPIWSDENLLYTWLHLEIDLRVARHRNPKAKLHPVVKDLFRKRRGKPLRVLHDMSKGKHLEIATAGTARRRHSEAQQLLDGNPQLADRWERLADWGAAGELEIARKLYP